MTLGLKREPPLVRTMSEVREGRQQGSWLGVAVHCAHSGWTRTRLDECKPRLGQGSAVPMVDNGLERRWEKAQACTLQVERRLGTATDGSARLGHARGRSS